MLYVGGGCSSTSRLLCGFASLTGIPLANTLTGLGSYPTDGGLSLGMLRVHGHNSDLLLAFGVRFDDRATGRLESFARGATVVHVDIDPAEIGKRKAAPRARLRRREARAGRAQPADRSRRPGCTASSTFLPG